MSSNIHIKFASTASGELLLKDNFQSYLASHASGEPITKSPELTGLLRIKPILLLHIEHATGPVLTHQYHHTLAHVKSYMGKCDWSIYRKTL